MLKILASKDRNVPQEKLCPDCQQTLTHTYFFQNLTSPDGLDDVCQVCKKARCAPSPVCSGKGKSAYIPFHVRAKLKKDGFYFCSGCGSVMSEEYFYNSKRSSTGKAHKCKACYERMFKKYRKPLTSQTS